MDEINMYLFVNDKDAQISSSSNFLKLRFDFTCIK